MSLPAYVAYYLGHPAVREWIVRHSVGATMLNLNTGILAALPVALPPIADQHAIADVLSTIEDKIELNRQMNQTLEETTQAIFKSWFFEHPGEQPPIAIRTGWKTCPIGEVVNVVGGSTPSTAEPLYWGGDFHFLTPKDMSNLVEPILLDTARTITSEGLNTISSGLLPPGTVVLSSRAPIGYLAITETPMAINQGIIAMVCDRGVPNYYVLHWVRYNMETIKAAANGTTFPEISKGSFRSFKILVPTREVLDQFAILLEPLYQRIASNLKESQTLAALRDTLLPKLLSGEIRVKQAEKIAESVL